MQLSIITINYNNKSGLKQTVESVLSQSFTDFEYIVIDGGSTDGSVDIIKNNSGEIDYWVSENDFGIYDALNKGIGKANGNYLMFLNSGDCFAGNNTLDLVHQQLNNAPDIDVFYGDTYFKTRNPDKTSLHKHPAVLDLWFLKDKNLNHQSTVIKSGLFKEFGCYPLEYKLAADHWLYLKSFIAGKRFLHIDCALAIYDRQGLSHTNYELYRQEMTDMWENLVPEYAKQLIDKLEEYRRKFNFVIVKVSIAINAAVQKIRNKH